MLRMVGGWTARLLRKAGQLGKEAIRVRSTIVLPNFFVFCGHTFSGYLITFSYRIMSREQLTTCST